MKVHINSLSSSTSDYTICDFHEAISLKIEFLMIFLTLRSGDEIKDLINLRLSVNFMFHGSMLSDIPCFLSYFSSFQ